LTSCASGYPERDLNPHNRNGHRILSPACLPFHHPGGILLSISKNQSCVSDPVPCSGNSTIRAEYFYLSQKTSPVCRTLSRAAGIPPSGRNTFIYLKKPVLCVGPCPVQREFHHPGGILLSISKNQSCVSDPVPHSGNSTIRAEFRWANL
jgi:hypothetical protein